MTDSSVSPAEDAFAEFLEGGAEDFEALCAERPELERELRRMHAAWRELDGALDALGSEAAADAEHADLDAGRLSARRDRYEAREHLATGGMGEVRRVWDPDLRRALAMKCMLAGGTRDGRADPRALARFLAEARVTGQLEHPGIPPVHELGLDPSGRLYFTMPLVDGVDLRTLLARMRSGEAPDWSPTRVLGVLQRVCDAVAYAHSRGVVHRDLKPANVMVGRFGEVYVMDWGLAKVSGDGARGAAEDAVERGRAELEHAEFDRLDGPDDPDSAALTRPGAVLGTPSYMAPEQARGEHDRIGPAADVYSAGAVLYEALTGHAPFVPPGASSSSEDVLGRVLAGPPAPIRQLVRDVPPELEAICGRAMARAPEERYADMSALAADLRAYVEGRVVQAHRTGTWAELSTWIGRNRALASASILAATLLLVGLAVSTALLVRARAAEELAGDNAARLAAELRTSHIEQGRQHAEAGNMGAAEELLWPEFLRAPDSEQAFWALWERYAREPVLATLTGDPIRITRVRIDPDGEWLASGGRRGWVHLWSPADWSERGVLRVAESEIKGLESVDGGALLLAASETGEVALCDPDRGRFTDRWPVIEGGVSSTAVSPDGAVLATGSPDGRVRLWRLPDGALLAAHTQHTASVLDLAWSPDGDRLASASLDGAVGLWADRGRRFVERLTDHEGSASAVAFDPTGTVLTSGGDDQQTILRRPGADPPLWLDGHNGTVRDLEYLADGRQLAIAGWYRVDLWRMGPDVIERSYSLPVHSWDVEVSPGGDRLAVALADGDVRVLELGQPDGERDRSAPVGRTIAAAAAGGTRSAFHDPHHGVRLFEDLLDERPATVIATEVDALAFDRAGALLALGGTDGALVVVDAATGEERARFADYGPNGANGLDLSPDGDLVVYTTAEGGVSVRTLADGVERCRLAPTGDQPLSVRFDPTGERFVLKVRRRPLSAWTVDGSLCFEVEQDGTSWTADWNADGSLLVGGIWYRDLRVWDGRTGALLRELPGHAATPWAVSTHPSDPDLAASAAGDGRWMLWNVREGRNLVRLELSNDDLTTIAFAADGRGLVAGSRAGQARAWRLDAYTRHIAGNLGTHLEDAGADVAVDAEGLESWARRVLRGETDGRPGGR